MSALQLRAGGGEVYVHGLPPHPHPQRPRSRGRRENTRESAACMPVQTLATTVGCSAVVNFWLASAWQMPVYMRNRPQSTACSDARGTQPPQETSRQHSGEAGKQTHPWVGEEFQKLLQSRRGRDTGRGEEGRGREGEWGE